MSSGDGVLWIKEEEPWTEEEVEAAEISNSFDFERLVFPLCGSASVSGDGS
jgi:hypothetical protein